MAANPPAASTICVQCEKLLRVGHVADDELQWVDGNPTIGTLKDVIFSKDTPVTIITARVQRFRKNANLKTCDCFEDLKKTFNQIFKMSRIWWSDWCRRSGGFFGSEDTFDDSDQLDGHNSWFRCDVKQIKKDLVSKIDKAGGKDYTWWKMNVFIRWDAATHRSLVVILDPLDVVELELLSGGDGIIRLLDEQALSRLRTASSPYYIPALFMEAAIHWHNKAVMGTRDLVRDIEKDHERKWIHDPSSERLHPGMRHVIHVTEMLETQIIIAVQMMEAHKLFVEENLQSAAIQQGQTGTSPTTASDVLNRKVVFRIRNATIALQTLLHRAQSNSTRLHNEVTLSSNVLSADIAKAAQTDNSIMKTLGLLGTAFLPATFIAALFSTSFFGTDNNGNWIWHWQMWYYFVITVPLTITVVFWTWKVHPWIRRRQEKAARAKLEAERNALEQRNKVAEAEAKVESEANSRTPTYWGLKSPTFLARGGVRFPTFQRASTARAGRASRASMAVSPTSAQPPVQLVPLAKQQSATASSASARSGAGSGLGISNSAVNVPRGDQPGDVGAQV